MAKNESYEEFVEKFKPKKTTDDCYTPNNIYAIVADYVSKYYGRDAKNFVRPFYPGGDYQKVEYAANCTVVDNPPFNIISQICKWYNKHNIKFFLFAPTLTCMGIRDVSKIVCGYSIVYENGAKVNTSFVTNMDEFEFRSCPELYTAIKEANKINTRQKSKELPKFEYPNEVITGSKIANFSKYGVEFAVKSNNCYFIRALDAQREKGKDIFGSGYLLSEKATAEKVAAEKVAAEKVAAEHGKAVEKWKLSCREEEIVKSLR